MHDFKYTTSSLLFSASSYKSFTSHSSFFYITLPHWVLGLSAIAIPHRSTILSILHFLSQRCGSIEQNLNNSGTQNKEKAGHCYQILWIQLLRFLSYLLPLIHVSTATALIQVLLILHWDYAKNVEDSSLISFLQVSLDQAKYSPCLRVILLRSNFIISMPVLKHCSISIT